MESFNSFIINLSNLKSNYNQIKNCVGNNVKVCAMVKADAYGHGLVDVCKTLSFADYFGVANVLEAKIIRKFNKKTKILVVGVSSLNSVLWCSKNNVSVTVSSLNELNNIIKKLNGESLGLHIKVNTGLNRIGVAVQTEFKQMLKVLKLHNNLVLEGVFTHFATKFEDIKFIKCQHNKFSKFIKLIKNKSVIVHCCNSYATLQFNKYHYDMVRCGFNLYGWQLDNKFLFKPVLNILSKVVFIHKIKKGETVGYDRSYKAEKDMVVGVLPIGYADGLDRRLSNNFSVLINGEFVPIIGNICMDVCMVDLTNVSAVVGDEVTILGKNGDKVITVYSYAEALGTSPYEVLLKFKYSRMNKILLK